MSDLTLWGDLYAGALLICLWRIGGGLAGIAARAVTRNETILTVRTRRPRCDALTPEATDGNGGPAPLNAATMTVTPESMAQERAAGRLNDTEATDG